MGLGLQFPLSQIETKFTEQKPYSIQLSNTDFQVYPIACLEEWQGAFAVASNSSPITLAVLQHDLFEDIIHLE